jgi:hypothetical protein
MDRSGGGGERLSRRLPRAHLAGLGAFEIVKGQKPVTRLAQLIDDHQLAQQEGHTQDKNITTAKSRELAPRALIRQISRWAEGIFVTLFGLDLGVPCRNPGDNGDRLRRPVTWPPHGQARRRFLSL